MGMKGLLLGAALLAACAHVRAEDEEDVIEWIQPEPTPVPAFSPLMELTEETFDAAIAENEFVLVEFYAKWCGVCKMVQPEYVSAAWKAFNISFGAKFGRVDVDKQKDLTDRYGVTSFPTFFFFRNGEPEPFPMLMTDNAYIAGVAKMIDHPHAGQFSPAKEFEGDDSAALAQWLFWRGANEGRIQNTLVLYEPPLDHILAAQNAHIQAAAAAVGAPDAPGADLPPPPHLADAAAFKGSLAGWEFDTAAKELMRNPNFRFAKVRSTSVMEDFGIPTDRVTVQFYTDHDEGRAQFEMPPGPPKPQDLIDWTLARSVPLVTVVTHRNLQKYRRNVKNVVLFLVTEPQAESQIVVSRLTEKLRAIAYDLEAKGLVTRGNFTIGIVNGKKYRGWAKHYGVPDDAPLPIVVAEDTKTESLFRLGDGLDAIRQFSEAAACDSAALKTYQQQMVEVGADEVLNVKLPAFCPVSEPELVEVELDADGSQAKAKASTPGEGVEHPHMAIEALTWVDVPSAPLASWLEGVLSGITQPIRPPTKAEAA